MASPDCGAPRPPGWGGCGTAISEDGAQDSWALRPPQDTCMNSLLGCMADSHLACELSQDTATWPHHGSHWCGCRRAPLFLVSVPDAMASLPPTGAQARSWLCPRPILWAPCSWPGQSGARLVSWAGTPPCWPRGRHKLGDSHCPLLAQSPQLSQRPSRVVCCLCDMVLTFQGSCPLRQTSGLNLHIKQQPHSCQGTDGF